MEHSSFNTKKIIIFSQKRFSYIEGNGYLEKKSLYFRKRNFLISQETETHK